MPIFSGIDELLEIWVEASKNFGISSNEVKHAGAVETSILLAEKEELVKKEKIRKGYIGELKPTSSLFAKGVKAFSEAGVLGDPTKGSEKLGKKVIEETVDYLVKMINEEAGT